MSYYYKYNMINHIFRAFVVVIVVKLILGDAVDNTQLVYIHLTSVFGFMLLRCIMRSLYGDTSKLEPMSGWKLSDSPETILRGTLTRRPNKNTSREDCKSVCDSDPNCKGYAMWIYPDPTKDYGECRHFRDITHVYKNVNFPTELEKQPHRLVDGTMTERESNVDHQTCSKECQGDPNCRAYNFSNYEGPNKCLKIKKITGKTIPPPLPWISAIKGEYMISQYSSAGVKADVAGYITNIK